MYHRHTDITTLYTENNYSATTNSTSIPLAYNNIIAVIITTNRHLRRFDSAQC